MKVVVLALTIASVATAPCLAGWPKTVQDIRYPSNADATGQPAMFYAPKTDRPVPLLVGLHSWSADYRQKSSAIYAQWCIDKRWAFIAPNFRGPNKVPQATGSDLAVADIVSAVAYAKKNANVDPDRIYLVGVSGGGYAAVLMAGLHPKIWAGVSAWVPITDLAAWHAECKESKRKYWRDLEKSCGGAPGSSAEVDAEYKKRSAITHIAGAKNVNLDLNAGIHDGHTGSVPISHTLRAFNALTAEEDHFSADQIRHMTETRTVAEGIEKPKPDPTYGDKQPLVRRIAGRTRITIFQGGHEIIPEAALTWLSRQRKTDGAREPDGPKSPGVASPWKRHAIDPAGPGGNGLSGADGVRMADVNGDGLMATVTGWEESRAIRICLHPGKDKAQQPWPAVTVGRIKSAEDAIFGDLDGDGAVDVVSCTEGRNKTVYFHWAPKNRSDLLKPEAWKTQAVPATAGKESWMFALPMDIDGKNGLDLIVGSKGKNGSVSWLESPAEPRNVADWKLHKIVDAGWIMSLRSAGHDTKLASVYVTDRKGKTRGLFLLDPKRQDDGTVTWTRRNIGGENHEVMFMALDPSSGAFPRLLVATRNRQILEFKQIQGRLENGGSFVGWHDSAIPNPFGVRNGKAVRIGDIDGDGQPDIVHTVNRDRQKDKPGVTWLKKIDGRWKPFDLGGPGGTKFDRIELYDIDQDGDLDVITCEENGGQKSMGLGLIWYENPHK
ncbi:MAG: prolyl oligopeptidase family serine peptidase [Phycisphaeraceae bacterium]|nr:prolyl oligopeptidase family serine peptidase [Phycisphaeraceae bacterium]